MEIKSIMIPEGLRFAPIIRVSTERSEKKGESLKVQKQLIREYINYLKGVIPETCWRYSGQEHATPDQERVKLDQLLEDASRGVFDAVIVCDPSRWSRDNMKSKTGLQIFRDNAIRFFVGTTEYNLFDPTQNLFLGMSAEIGEYQARIQSLKSMLTRIKRAKEGRPSAGALPFGRTWSLEKGWGIDPEKKAMIEDVARRYIKGEQMTAIAKSYKWNKSHLFDIMKTRCGPEWVCSFVQENININEKVIVRVPELLDEATRKEIEERTRNNITFVRGHRKYVYLLGGMVFCRHCGYAMVGNTSPHKKQYYRHSPNGTCHCINRFVPARELENSVLLMLVKSFGDPELITKAIEKATPDILRVAELHKEMEGLEVEEQRIKRAKKNLIKQVAEETFKGEDIKEQMKEYDDRLIAITERRNTIKDDLDQIPDPENVKKASKWAAKVISNATRQNPGLIFKRSLEWKRKFLEGVFNGVGFSGERLGVYVDVVDDPITFEIKGKLIHTMNSFPLTDEDIIEIFQLDPEFQDFDKEIAQIRKNLESNRSGLGFTHPFDFPYLAGAESSQLAE